MKSMVTILALSLLVGLAVPVLAQTNWGWSTLQEYEEATGTRITEFRESPGMSELVQRGQLPPVEQRISDEPLVDKVFEEIGRYGGTLHLAQVSPSVYYPASLHTIEYLLTLDRDGLEVVPNIAKGWEFDNDGKSFRLFLRKGMRWSDGHPFTADDFLFFWEHVMLDKEITPVLPDQFRPGGEPMQVSRVDPYTVQFDFSVPYWSFVYNLAGVSFRGHQNWIFLPKHALKEYHIAFNPDADKEAQAAGYEHWWQQFNMKRDYNITRMTSPDIPQLGPWVTSQVLPSGVIYDRNPFYFKIDTDGNQLPYVDRVTTSIFGDVNTVVMKMVAGEYDYQDWTTSMNEYPTLMEGADRGGYNVWNAENLWTAHPSIIFNQNYEEDALVGQILRDVRFRQAMSLAIDRDEFNDLMAFGTGVPMQATLHPSAPFYRERWGNTHTQHDPTAANLLLDEMGLTARDSDGFRLKPDGQPFTLIITQSDDVVTTEMMELIRDYWEIVGIRTSVRVVERAYLYTLVEANGHMVTTWVFDSASALPVSAGFNPWLKGIRWGNSWQRWWNTSGAAGEEPPQAVQRMFGLYQDVPYMSDEDREDALTEIFDIWADNLWIVGTIGLVPKPAVSKVNLGNVNMETFTDNADIGCGTFNRLYQLFWK